MESVIPATDPGAASRGGAVSRWRGGSFWLVGAMVVAVLVLMPVIAIIWIAFNPTENIWPHLLDTILPRYVSNTLLLMLGVGAGTVFGGVVTAWLVTMCRFPFRRFFEWALVLPLAMPAYVVAYVYTDLLEFAGPVQGALRDAFGWSLKSDYWFPSIRTHGGAITVMSLVLYPYVYMLTRAAFLQQSVCVLEAGRVLGRGPWRCFFTVALPLARPALVAGTALALMETLNDFGTIDYFGIHTLTAGVFEVWLLMGNTGGAAQISLVMLVFVIGLLWIERSSRRRQRFHQTTNRYQALPGYPLNGVRRIAAIVVCAVPIVFGFVLPAAILAGYAIDHFQESWSGDYLIYVRNSLLLSSTAAGMAVMIGLFLAYAVRLNGGPMLRMAVRLSSVGYAVPGAVLAVGVLVPFAALDNSVDAAMRESFGISTGLILSGTAFAVIFAYVVRFLAVAYGGIDASLGKVTKSMDDASRILGHGPLSTLKLVHLPLIRGGILGGAVLVFVDSMKELPATLILRPFNFDTLATHVYQFASDELLAESALGALTIVAAGVLPVILLSRAIRTARPGHRDPFA
ncbi:MAG: iron ABC transporter permease [Alphaproteobacteria bacterium]